jgi:hypothetical protein
MPDPTLAFLLHMKAQANHSRARGRRVHYTDEDKGKAMSFLSAVESAGGDLEAAAELMSMHRSTLLGWLDRYTDPRANFPPVNVQVNVSLG